MSTNRIAALFSNDGGPAFGDLLEATATQQRFTPGCRVRVRSGVLAGAEGTVLAYCSDSRLIVAVDLSCPGVTLEIDEQKLTLLDG
ncbi:MAG TPA: hypothetical protein VG826_28375 [Pirellulales bacterium]|nr:hypothetical protein [Pirellulales bacterium]